MLNRTWNYVSQNLNPLNSAPGPRWNVPDIDLGKAAHLPPSLAQFIQVIFLNCEVFAAKDVPTVVCFRFSTDFKLYEITAGQFLSYFKFWRKCIYIYCVLDNLPASGRCKMEKKMSVLNRNFARFYYYYFFIWMRLTEDRPFKWANLLDGSCYIPCLSLFVRRNGIKNSLFVLV